MRRPLFWALAPVWLLLLGVGQVVGWVGIGLYELGGALHDVLQ